MAISGHQWPSAVISGPHLPRGLMKSEPLITRVTKVSPRERWHCPPSNEPMSSEALATAPAQLPALPALASWSAIGACSYVDAPTRQRAQSEAIRGQQRPSEAIRGHQWPSEAISGHQGGHLRLSLVHLEEHLVVDLRNQRQLEVIRGN